MSSRTYVKPQMLIKEAIHKTRKLLKKSLTNLKPPTPERQTKTPILDDVCSTFSEKRDSVDVVKTKHCRLSPKVEPGSMTNSCCSELLEGSKDEKKDSKYSRRQQKEPSFLAQKMRDLEMMDLNDVDHEMDVEEVLYFYSRITCQVFVEIVDRFFVDMYMEFHVPQPSRSFHGSMRKMGSESVHSSMTSLGPLEL